MLECKEDLCVVSLFFCVFHFVRRVQKCCIILRRSIFYVYTKYLSVGPTPLNKKNEASKQNSEYLEPCILDLF